MLSYSTLSLLAATPAVSYLGYSYLQSPSLESTPNTPYMEDPESDFMANFTKYFED